MALADRLIYFVFIFALPLVTGLPFRLWFFAPEEHRHYDPLPTFKYGEHSYPLFYGNVPDYIQWYRDSGSRYDMLLAGLAIYNLGKKSVDRSHDEEYPLLPGEYCKLVIISLSILEESRIDCDLISSFLWKPAPLIVATSARTTAEVYAVAVQGPSLRISEDMRCFVALEPMDGERRMWPVACGLLQKYAQLSFADSVALAPTNALLILLVFYVLVIDQSI